MLRHNVFDFHDKSPEAWPQLWDSNSLSNCPSKCYAVGCDLPITQGARVSQNQNAVEEVRRQLLHFNIISRNSGFSRLRRKRESAVATAKPCGLISADSPFLVGQLYKLFLNGPSPLRTPIQDGRDQILGCR
jgi:hypothetical protein